MKWLKTVLAELMLSSHVTVEIPGLDIQELAKAIHGAAETTLGEIERVMTATELSDGEKVREIMVFFR